MKQRVCKGLLCLCLLVWAIHLAGKLVLPTTLADPLCAVRAITRQPRDSYDVLVFGSSHAWKGVDTRVLRDMGISAYNMATDWQRINTVNLFVEAALRRQHPRVVLIETFYVNDVTQKTDLNGEIYMSKNLPPSMAKARYLYRCFGRDPERYLSYLVPIVAFHENWKDIKRRTFVPERNESQFSESLGYYVSDAVTPQVIPDIRSLPQNELIPEARRELDELVAACRERGAEVLFFTIPYNGEYRDVEAIRAYAQENGCRYVNLFDEVESLGIDASTDYQDTDHLNAAGAGKIAGRLGEILRESYSL